MQFSDLSSEGLARLEAKLLADVEVVRRMRVLLEEHRVVWENRPAGAVPAVRGMVGTPVAAPVPAPRRPVEAVALECLQALPAETFVVRDLRRALRKQGTNLSDASLKTLMNRLGRQGKVVVEELRRGRGGSLYRCTLPRVPAGEASDLAAESSPPPADAEPSATAS